MSPQCSCGPRVCIGARFALAEATLVLAILVKNFELALADTRPVLPVAAVTTRPDHAVAHIGLDRKQVIGRDSRGSQV
jgi:cytochrome P450